MDMVDDMYVAYVSVYTNVHCSQNWSWTQRPCRAAANNIRSHNTRYIFWPANLGTLHIWRHRYTKLMIAAWAGPCHASICMIIIVKRLPHPPCCLYLMLLEFSIHSNFITKLSAYWGGEYHCQQNIIGRVPTPSLPLLPVNKDDVKWPQKGPLSSSLHFGLGNQDKKCWIMAPH